MNSGQTVLSQLLSYLPRHTFRQCVRKYRGNHKVKNFSCWEQFICMSFAQLTYRESLRDIEICLRSYQKKLYHSGLQSKVAKSTLADANERRDWRIYEEFAHKLIPIAQELYKNESIGFELDETVYALDSTTIDLCLSLFPWAHFRKTKSAIKLHTLLDIRTQIPTFIHITEGSVHDVNILDKLIIEPKAIYLMDRGYIDFSKLFKVNQQAAFFIIRAKKNLAFRRLYSHKIDKGTGLKCDQTITFKNQKQRKAYPEKLRRIKYTDQDAKTNFTFLTNCFELEADTIQKLYKKRWQIELFFKWIKQNLRIKSFYGHSKNAVKTQIWIAITVYILVAIVKKRLKVEKSLYSFLQILSVGMFDKTPILRLIENDNYKNIDQVHNVQLNLFDL